MSFPMRQKLFVPGLALAILIPLVIGYVAYRQGQENSAAAEWVNHTYRVRAELQTVLIQLVDASSSTRGFIITGQESFLRPLDLATAKVPASLASLKRLTADNAGQQRRVGELESLTLRRFEYSQRLIALARTQAPGVAEAVVSTGEGSKLMDDIRVLIAEMDSA